MRVMKSFGLITKIGPAPGNPKLPMDAPPIPFRTEVQMDSGSGLLELTRDAAEELANELDIYLQLRGFR